MLLIQMSGGERVLSVIDLMPGDLNQIA